MYTWSCNGHYLQLDFLKNQWELSVQTSTHIRCENNVRRCLGTYVWIHTHTYAQQTYLTNIQQMLQRHVSSRGGFTLPKGISVSGCNPIYPESKVHGASMGPTWVLLAPDGPHVGPMNLAIRVVASGLRRPPSETWVRLRTPLGCADYGNL